MKKLHFSQVGALTLCNEPAVDGKFVRLGRSSSTALHHHHDLEMWFIVSGSGTIVSSSGNHEVTSGDVVQWTEKDVHSITNVGDEELVFFTSWWNGVSDTPTKKPVLLLTAFPTPNGPPHLGHISGPYLGADIYKRAEILRGNSARMLSGTIGYLNWIVKAAAERDETNHQTAEFFSNAISRGFSSLEIKPDTFVTFKDEDVFADITRRVFSDFLAKGIVKYEEGQSYWSSDKQEFLFESEITGRCPICRTDGASNLDCEQCGYVFDEVELLDARSSKDGRPLQLRPLKRYYFDLECARAPLQRWLANISTDYFIKSYIARCLSRRLPRIPVSYISTFGVEIGQPEAPNQRIFSYFELLSKYLVASHFAGIPTDELKSYSLIGFCGYDNLYRRTILFPAMIALHLGEEYMPMGFVYNYFLTLEGRKFSTSQNHAVWAEDAVRTHSVDQLRYYLAKVRPEKTTADYDRLAVEREWTAFRVIFDRAKNTCRRLLADAPLSSLEYGEWDDSLEVEKTLIDQYLAVVDLSYSHSSFSTARVIGATTELLTRFSNGGDRVGELNRFPRALRTYKVLRIDLLSAVTWALAPILSEELREIGAAIVEKKLTPNSPALRKLIVDHMCWSTED
jgi:methionyl-tRNA synthetase